MLVRQEEGHLACKKSAEAIQSFPLAIWPRVVKTAQAFWPFNRDQKDWLTAAAYAAVKVGYMTL